MSEYWLISAPGDKTCQQTWEKLCNATKQNNLSQNYKFSMPDLKVGTLDQLVGLSDDLAKLDTFVEGVTRKLAAYLLEVLDDQKDKVEENLEVNGVSVSTYLTKFTWDMAKYPVRQSLSNIADIISKQVSQIDAELKAKASAYNTLKTTLQNLERKATGSLLVRSLDDVVKKEHFVLGSEFLTTLLVVIPKSSAKEWESNYENLSNHVVPRSSIKIYEDHEHCLYNVTIIRLQMDKSKKDEDPIPKFKEAARNCRFIVRDFEYSEEKLSAGKTALTKLKNDKTKQLGLLFRWLKLNFGEAFHAWIHVKDLRVFVESVLRYGLPVNFQAMLLQPNKSPKKLREVLNKLYSHLDTSIAAGPVDDIPGLNIGQQEYFPYVYFKINIDMLDASIRRN